MCPTEKSGAVPLYKIKKLTRLEPYDVTHLPDIQVHPAYRMLYIRYAIGRDGICVTSSKSSNQGWFLLFYLQILNPKNRSFSNIVSRPGSIFKTENIFQILVGITLKEIGIQKIIASITLYIINSLRTKIQKHFQFLYLKFGMFFQNF